MSYRTDKFQVGDRVVWDMDFHPYFQKENVEKYGVGPFTVLSVKDRPNDDYPDEHQSIWDSMGHTQHIDIITPNKGQFSGAWFKKEA